MFASKVTSTVTITDPYFGDVVVTIQKLSGNAQEKALNVRSEEQMRVALQLNAALSSSAMGDRVAEARAQAEAAAAAAVAAPPADGDAPPVEVAPAVVVDTAAQREARYQRYDRDTVVRSGVRSWLCGDKEKPLPQIQAGVQDLDDDAMTTLHRAILDLSLPSLDEENARKNG